MVDRAEVISQLERCTLQTDLPIRTHKDACAICHYKRDGRCNFTSLMADALALLKGHIMTPEEVEAVGQQELVWVELRRTDALYAAIREGNDFTTVGNDDYFILSEVTDCDDYLRWYRFWSAQPSEERRHATPWEETDG